MGSMFFNHRLPSSLFPGAFLLLIGMGMSGCGYHLRGNTRPFFDQNHIHNLYVAPVKNNSYKAGVEITVYNALRKRIALGGYVRIVDKKSDADATFSATVIDASYTPAAITTGDQITADGGTTYSKLSSVQIAKSYNVNLSVQFRLDQEHPAKLLWGDQINRGQSFPATVYIGALGSTSALINESDFERALGELATAIVTDAEESVNTIF
jgi:hypothetical protein